MESLFRNAFTIRNYILGFLLLSTSCCLGAASLLGKVISVSDGDTITVLGENNIQYKVRLAGIDAPEKGQSFGEESKKNLSELVFEKTVEVDW